MKGSITPMIRNRRILVTVIATGLVLLTSIPGRSDSGGIPNENAKGYWNRENMANATPIELVVDQKSGIGTVQPAAGGRNSGTVSTGTSTTKLATSDWPEASKIAQTAVGKVFFSVGAKNYVCSGSFVKDGDPNRAIVLTAGHCAWDQTTKKFVTNWAFVPNYDAMPSGPIWYASALVLRNEFAQQARFNTTALQHDWAFAVILPKSSTSGTPAFLNPSGDLPDSNDLNSYDYNAIGFSSGNISYAFGYPAATPYDGTKLKYAGATIFEDPNTSRSTWGMNSDMTGGASGGPWLSLTGTEDGLQFGLSGNLSSLNSYKYNIDPSKMYGPKFNVKTTATLNAARTALTNTRV